MQIFTREVILERLLLVSDLVALQQAAEPAFISETIRWMEATEQKLERLRSPLASFCAAERARALAALDGVSEGGGAREAKSSRKAIRAALALSLGRVEHELRQAVLHHDRQLDLIAEKVAQLLAMAPSGAIAPPPPEGMTPAYTRTVWQALGQLTETRNLHRYVSARMSADDRKGLLEQALEHMFEDTPAP